MPTYVYQCDDCELAFEEIQGYHDDPLVSCPQCSQDTLYRLLFAPYVSVVQDPTSVAQLAARNTKKMGHYELEARVHQDAVAKGEDKPKKNPWFRPDKDKPDLSLAKLSPEKVVKYIREGKK